MKSGFGRNQLQKCLWLRAAATVPVSCIRKAGAGSTVQVLRSDVCESPRVCHDRSRGKTVPCRLWLRSEGDLLTSREGAALVP